MNREQAKQISIEVEAALKAIATKYNLAIEVKGGRFTQTTFTPKIEFSEISASGQAETKERTAFKQLAHLYGLKSDHLDKSFTVSGKTYTIIGLNARRNKSVLLASGDKRYCMSPDIVSRFVA